MQQMHDWLVEKKVDIFLTSPPKEWPLQVTMKLEDGTDVATVLLNKGFGKRVIRSIIMEEDSDASATESDYD